MVQYSYGLNIVESVSQYTKDTYRINVYHAHNKESVGVTQSHGMTYAECREQLKLLGVPMGLDTLIKGR